MDPDVVLHNLLDLFLPDMNDEYPPPTSDEVREHTEALEQWHYNRGFLPRWPVHLDSGLHFARMRVGSQLRAECIALLTRVQVAIEEESRSLYVAAVSNLGGWAARALDSEDQVGVGEPEDLVGFAVLLDSTASDLPEDTLFLCVGVDPHNAAQVILKLRDGMGHPTGNHEWRVHWGQCNPRNPVGLPADWRCPRCKTRDATVSGNTVTCAHGHESQ